LSAITTDLPGAVRDHTLLVSVVAATGSGPAVDSPRSIEEQLAIYLTDAHAIELQALVQVKRAPKIAGDPEIAAAFEKHIGETERHERFVKDRLTAMSWEPVPQKDIAGRVSGVGFALFARFQPDTPGKLVAHAYSYEHMELAAYDLLGRVAERAGDPETKLTAELIAKDERAMIERLTGLTDRAVDASLRELGRDDIGKQLDTYLADAHAIEQQATQLLSKGPKLAGADELAHAYEEHLTETRRHSELVEERLRARGAKPSTLKDAAMRLGALNWGLFFGAQPDTPAKLAGFSYAFEHLEVAAYKLLQHVAARADDRETVKTADTILLEERAAAAKIRGLFDQALDASLHEAGVTA
jgi:ferritin-like metal-binding protein YciE